MKNFIIFLFLTTFGLIPSLSLASSKDLSHDGKLAFFHVHFREYIEITYEKNGKLQDVALSQINHFLRSRDSGEIKEIDLELIYLIDHLQDHFEVSTIYLISGYRSPTFNAYLKSIGRNVSVKSNHMFGKAMDIHFDEISEKALWEYAKSLSLGGAGYYPDINMVHIDVGDEVKTWVEGRFTDRTDIGFFYEETKIKLRTDRLFYYEDAKLKLRFEKKVKHQISPKIILQKFVRGKWSNTKEITINKKTLKKWMRKKREALNFQFFYTDQVQKNNEIHSIKETLKLKLDHGRYRFKIKTIDDKKQLSNEFYFKKNLMSKEDLLNQLEKYQSTDPYQIKCRNLMVEFIHKNPKCFDRDLEIGHFTASAFLLNPSEDKVLLTHHKKLNKWIQLGGHADGNSNLLEVAVNEAREESGILDIIPISQNIFDLDIHQIPKIKNDSEHLHYDVRFLLKSIQSEEFKISKESINLKWFNLIDDQKKYLEKSVIRMFDKYKEFKPT